MSLKHAILGFLSIRPLSGYDLKKAIDGTVGHFWTADQAQIYRMLASLVGEELVEVTHIEQRLRIATLENGIMHTQAVIDWATALLAELSQEY
jgi:DNA-binding PadR family transcriptional regulator